MNNTSIALDHAMINNILLNKASHKRIPSEGAETHTPSLVEGAAKSYGKEPEHGENVIYYSFL